MSQLIEPRLRKLLDQAESIKKVAEKSGVSYDKLIRWVRLDTKILDVTDAELVYKALTGNTFK